MTDETIKKLENFLNSFSKTHQPLLLLDYDGTLAPFRVDRFKARPWTGVREAIGRIQRQGRTRMVVITGRPAKEIGPLLRGYPPVVDPMLEVWGLHGAERLHPDGRRELEEAPPVAEKKASEETEEEDPE